MFNKNLELINNDALKRRLMRISPIESRVGITYCVTPTNDYVLLKDDVAIDDLQNPREAVKQALKNCIKSEMRKNDIIINFGIGLGYLLDETFNSYPSRIYIYEPDLNLLHFVLSNVDISEHLASGRVYITNDLDEMVKKVANSYLTKDRIEIAYLQNYGLLKNKEFLILTQRVFDACKSKMIDISTIAKFSKKWLFNSIDNIAYANLNDIYLLSDLENKFYGKTALIAGAGPSLADNIEKIKTNRDKLVIFALNKNSEYLQKEGIIPDFIVSLDAENMDRTLSNLDSFISKTNAIIDVRTDSDIVTKPFKKIFMNFSATDFFIKKVSKYNSYMKFYETGGTSSTFALASAIKMGFAKIILAGVDLAFKENVIYTNGETMKRVSQEVMVVDNIKKKLVQVKSVNGGYVSTRDDYQAFIQHFETIIKETGYTEIYNISSFGALIQGVKNVPFDDIDIATTSTAYDLSTVFPFKFRLEDFIKDEFIGINNIFSLLSRGQFSLELVSSIIKSNLVYQYIQSDVLKVLQENFDPELAQSFINNTKTAIKSVVERLQKHKLV